MHRSTATRRAARLFWMVVGGGLLVVGSFTLVWLLGTRREAPLTVVTTCVMMLRQAWELLLQDTTPVSFPGVLGVLLVGSGVWAGWRSLAAWGRTRRLVALSQPSRPGHGRALETALAWLPPVRHRVRVLPALHPVACTVGLWHPQIVLSAGLVTALTPAELRAVVGHEWAHVRRRDPLRLVVLRFWQDALWFLPIGRALARDSARSMEEAADDAAVALTAQPLDLAAALVKTAKAQVQPRGMPTPALGGELAVTERVERLLAVAPPRPPRRHTRSWLVSATVATSLLGLLMLPRPPVVSQALLLPFETRPSVMACPMHLPG